MLLLPSTTYQLFIGDPGTVPIIHKPPRSCSNGGNTNVNANSHVAEEQPATDERVLGSARGFIHNVNIRRVKTESSSRKSICDKIHPKELDRNESLWETQCCRYENTAGKNNNKNKKTTTGKSLKHVILAETTCLL